jgi:hypothetical protein
MITEPLAYDTLSRLDTVLVAADVYGKTAIAISTENFRQMLKFCEYGAETIEYLQSKLDELDVDS